MVQYITLFFCVAATAGGQLLIKKGMTTAGPAPAERWEVVTYFLKLLFLNPYIFSGLALAVLSTVSWMYTVSKLPLSFAYPFYSAAFPLVLLFSGLLFGEHVSVTRWIGMGIIMIGLVFVSKA